MRTAILTCAVILGLHQQACAKEIEVNAGTLGGWTVTGSAPAGSRQGLALPAGSRISRSYATDKLSLHLVTTPVFGVAAEDWPIIEIGSAALAFVRSGDEGKVVLLVGQAEPEALPYAFALDASGHPLEPVALEFGVQGGLVRVVHGNEVVGTAFEPAPVLEVAASAGAQAPWNFAHFVIQDGGDTLTTVTSSRSLENSNPAGSGEGATRQPVAAVLPRILSPGHQSPGPKNQADTASQSNSSAVRSLEVFTPPSVRQRIADRLAEANSKTTH